MITIFWLSLALLIYVYAGFPLLVAAAGILRKRNIRKREITPKLSLIIAAYNEEDGIGEKLNTLLKADYPSEALEIIVASDGSDDGTESIVSEYESKGVRLLSLPRRGKIYALNDAVASATGEILVFTDANSILELDALKKLARNFADPDVGGVCGCMKYRKRNQLDSSNRGEILYWFYELWLKQKETQTGSIVSASGAFYAIRRELYQLPPNAGMTDDFIISTAVIEQGSRLVFESDACVWEETAPSTEAEFGRKIRLMTRGLWAVYQRRKLLNPFRYGFYSILLFSHKILRRCTPIFLILMLISNLFIMPVKSLYFSTFYSQVAFYVLAAIGYAIRDIPLGKFKIFYIPFYYCLANAAALVAITKFIGGKRIELWQPQR